MGFFDKIAAGVDKAAAGMKGTCAICGKETVHVGKGEFACNECKKRLNMEGYENYRGWCFPKALPASQYPAYAQHRDAILEKYRNDSDRLDAVDTYVSAFIADNFAILRGRYNKVVVDHQDVFALSYTWNAKPKELNVKGSATCIFVAFTNDPYVPVYPMILFIKEAALGGPNKKALEPYLSSFAQLYPNLTYPVCEHKQLEKTIKSEPAVKGNIDKKEMLLQINNARGITGLFDVDDQVKDGSLSIEQTKEEISFMQQYGYEIYNNVTKGKR